MHLFSKEEEKTFPVCPIKSSKFGFTLRFVRCFVHTPKYCEQLRQWGCLILTTKTFWIYFLGCPSVHWNSSPLMDRKPIQTSEVGFSAILLNRNTKSSIEMTGRHLHINTVKETKWTVGVSLKRTNRKRRKSFGRPSACLELIEAKFPPISWHCFLAASQVNFWSVKIR